MKYKKIGILICMLLIATAALPVVVPENSKISREENNNLMRDKQDFQWASSAESENIKISINRAQYSSEEEIAIMLENIGEKTLAFDTFPKIEIFDENGEKVFPSYMEQGEWTLRPGEYEIYVWDQTDLEGKLIEPGKVSVRDILLEVEIFPFIMGIGYVILVAGDATGLETEIDAACKEIFDDLISIGFTEDRIQFLNTIDSSDWRVDDIATEDTVENAVKVWADSRVGLTQPLYIVMFDHGGGPSYGYSCCGSIFTFCVYNTVAGDYIYPASLRDWIDDLYASTHARIHVWDMSCHAGGFIPDISRDNHVIITSTVADQHTSVGPSPYYEYFSKYFWPKIVCGWSWLDAFNYASYHSHQAKENNVPQLDDDGNGEGHGVYDDIGTTSLNAIYRGYLPHHGDGYYADLVYMGNIRPRCLLLVIDWLLIMATHFFYPLIGDETIPVWAVLDSEVPLSSVKANLLDPTYNPMECGCLSEIPSECFEMKDDNNDGKWEVEIPVENFSKYDAEEFTIVLTAEGEEGENALPLYTQVSFAHNPPPDNEPPFVDIEKPGKGEILSGEMEIKISVSDNRKLGNIAIFVDNIKVKQYSPEEASHGQFATMFNTAELSEGFHTLQIQATDDYGNLIRKSIYFTLVGAPIKPNPPKGPTSGKIKTDCTYTAIAHDPQQDKVWYMFDWGDGTTSGWLGPFESGKPCEATHSWEEKGDYEIKVRAKDIFGKLSEWSDPLVVTMPKTKSFYYNFPFLNWLFERFPNAFPILRFIFG